MGNVANRQQPDQIAENNTRPQMGLQLSKKIPQLQSGFSWPLNKHVKMDNGHTKLQWQPMRQLSIGARHSWMQAAICLCVRPATMNITHTVQL